jgi:purine-nucleoside/S-methyl-5'-thioadenosine phosphorylase / adenosine deaminase
VIHLELPGGADALFTMRGDGNLSTMRGAGHARGEQARGRLCEDLGLRWLCAGPQVHGADVQRVRAQERSGGRPVLVPADGRATALRDVGAMVLTADCLPVLLASPAAVAAVHAGWRGIAAGVLEEGVRALGELERAAQTRAGGGECQSGDGTLVAVIGPGAGRCCYEVGAEVHAALGGGASAAAAHAGGPGRGAPIDIKAHARERLLAAGVQDVRDVAMCTICDARFFSHRREGDAAGRQAGIVWRGAGAGDSAAARWG